jgi:hypothetical protein
MASKKQTPKRQTTKKTSKKITLNTVNTTPINEDNIIEENIIEENIDEENIEEDIEENKNIIEYTIPDGFPLSLYEHVQKLFNTEELEDHKGITQLEYLCRSNPKEIKNTKNKNSLYIVNIVGLRWKKDDEYMYMNFDKLIEYNATQVKINESSGKSLFKKPIDKPFWIYVNLTKKEFKGIPFYNKNIYQVATVKVIQRVKEIEEKYRARREVKQIEEDENIAGI